MFNLQGSEIIIVLLLALVVLGPEKLPDAMRKMGHFYAELKKMSSGFQSEFRAAIDEPMREIRDTANVLRDSADFTKLQAGEREEKPKSAEMSTPGGPDGAGTSETGPSETGPSGTVPTFDTPDDARRAPELADDSKPAPFSGESSAAPQPAQPAVPSPAAPFPGMAPGVGSDELAPRRSDTATPEPDDARSEADPSTATEIPTGPDQVIGDENPAHDAEVDESAAAEQHADADDHTGHAR